jgi:type II secretory pathway pseudopilin PulG
MGLGQGVRRRPAVTSGERGYAMAALLIGLSIMAVLMGAALPVWSHHMKREREEELIWRGQQYARAIMLFQRKFANTFPPTLDVLVEQRFLRKKYKDPITNSDFQPIPAGGAMPGQIQQGGVQQQIGAASNAGSFSGSNAQSRVQGGVQVSVATLNQRSPGQTSFPGQQQGQGQGPMGGTGIGIQGVVSKSKDSSIKVYNGRTKHNEWLFTAMALTQRFGMTGGPPGAQQGGFPGAQPGSFPNGMQRPGFGQPPGARPPVQFPGSGMQPGQRMPFDQTPPVPVSPFTPPAPMGAPRPGPRPPGV